MKSLFVQIIFLYFFVNIFCGAEDVISWGLDMSGEIGRDHLVGDPILADLGGINVVDAFPGLWFSLIVSDQKQIFSFGSNINQQLGVENTSLVSTTTPQLIGVSQFANPKTIQIAAGWHHSVVVINGTQVFTFGGSIIGSPFAEFNPAQTSSILGRTVETKDQAGVPTLINLPLQPNENITSLCAGAAHTLLLTNQNRLITFGDPDFANAIGRFEQTGIPAPSGIFVQQQIAEVHCGAAYSVIVTKSRQLFTMGDNSVFQLGRDCGADCSADAIIGITAEKVRVAGSLTMIQPKGGNKLIFFGSGMDETQVKGEIDLKNIQMKDFKVGLSHLLIMDDSNVYSYGGCGDQLRGRLGCGTDLLPVIQNASVSAVFAGGFHSLVMLSNTSYTIPNHQPCETLEFCKALIVKPPAAGAKAGKKGPPYALFIGLGVILGIFLIGTFFLIVALRTRKLTIQNDIREIGNFAAWRKSTTPVRLPSAAPSLRNSSLMLNSMIKKINPSEVEIGGLIGSGNFGSVYKGTWSSVPVALKQLKGNIEEELEQELGTMALLKHPNVIRLLGVMTTEKASFIVLEYCAQGSMESFLREYQLGVKEKLQLLTQVAAGMKYLAAKNIIHRDLGARNVLLKEEGKIIAKICDFGLAREADNYYSSTGAQFPIKWSSPEAIKYRKFSRESDVWSFGILSWEIFSGGKIPYVEYTNAETIDQVMAGYRLPKPDGCPDDIYELMRQCWDIEPSKRPAWSAIISLVGQELNKELAKLGEDLIEFSDSSNNGSDSGNSGKAHSGTYLSLEQIQQGNSKIVTTPSIYHT